MEEYLLREEEEEDRMQDIRIAQQYLFGFFFRTEKEEEKRETFYIRNTQTI